MSLALKAFKESMSERAGEYTRLSVEKPNEKRKHNNRNHFHHRSSSLVFVCTHGNSNKLREAKRREENYIQSR